MGEQIIEANDLLYDENSSCVWYFDLGVEWTDVFYQQGFVSLSPQFYQKGEGEPLWFLGHQVGIGGLILKSHALVVNVVITVD